MSSWVLFAAFGIESHIEILCLTFCIINYDEAGIWRIGAINYKQFVAILYIYLKVQNIHVSVLICRYISSSKKRESLKKFDTIKSNSQKCAKNRHVPVPFKN